MNRMVGNLKNYTKWDVINCLFLINETKNISRIVLKEKLGVGEGTTRSILNDLKKGELIDSTQTGHSLTEKGEKIIKRIDNIITLKEIKDSKIKGSIGLLYKKTINQDIKNYMLRDEGIKKGAETVFILSYDGEKFIMPEKEDFDINLKEIFSDIKKGDTLIITKSDDLRLSNISALSIASFLSNELEIILNAL